LNKHKIKNLVAKNIAKTPFSIRVRTSLEQINLFLDSYSKIKDPNKSKKLEEIIRKYPEYPKVHLVKALENFSLRNWEFKDNLDTYARMREAWLSNSNLDIFNCEFLWPGLYHGAFGNHNQIFSLVKAKKLGLRRRNLVGFYKSKNLFTNKALLSYFEPDINLIQVDQFPSNVVFKDLQIPSTFIIQMDKFAPYQTFGANTVNLNEKNKGLHLAYELTEEHNSIGREFLANYGFNESKGDWFVTLHLREPTFRLETKTNTTENFRNVNLESYQLAIQEIIKMGGWVIRVGDKKMTPMFPQKHFIDYATLDVKSEVLDVFFGAKCAFAVTTSSGYRAVPTIFDRPQLQTNFLPGTHVYDGTSKDVFILRELVDYNSSTKIPLEEQINNPFLDIGKDKSYGEQKLIWSENSKEILLEGVRYMIAMNLNLKPNINCIILDNEYLNSTINPNHKYKPTLLSKVLQESSF
jgi:putative glycosyltransferase (TIGR04372 family)